MLNLDPRIKYYPVKNGDTSLISLSDNTKIIVDINITEDSEDDKEVSRYDVKDDLINELQKDNDIPYVDVFILTHPDNDHCRGFKKTFLVGDPSSFTNSEDGEEKIRIDELWFSPRIFKDKSDLSDDALDFEKEARRRVKLHKTKDGSRDEPGNRIKIIGYSDDKEIEGLDDLIYLPKSTINNINQSDKTDFAIHIHAPFKEDTDENESRNDASIVFQSVFNVNGITNAGLTIHGGDAGSEIWAKIVDGENDFLNFDLFLAPHHCSWKFFNTTSHSDNSLPSDSSIEVLTKGREGAIVISSSRTFEESKDDLPPHEKAKKHYKEEVTGDFLVTSEEPSRNKPLPIEFRITKNGPQRIEKSSSSSSKSGLVGGAISSPKTYG